MVTTFETSILKPEERYPDFLVVFLDKYNKPIWLVKDLIAVFSLSKVGSRLRRAYPAFYSTQFAQPDFHRLSARPKELRTVTPNQRSVKGGGFAMLQSARP